MSDEDGTTPETPVTYDEHLRTRAQTLLDDVTGGGVSPEVAQEFLRQLEVLISERREMEMWNQRGMSGAQWVASYPSQEKAAEAVQYLMTHGHGHHFAVIGEGQHLVVSKTGTECLQRFHQAEKERGERLEARRGPDLGDDPDGDVEGADWGTP
jgi:hypothetical protein